MLFLNRCSFVLQLHPVLAFRKGVKGIFAIWFALCICCTWLQFSYMLLSVFALLCVAVILVDAQLKLSSLGVLHAGLLAQC